MADRIDYRFVLRRGLAAEWAAQNGVLLEGEFGLELDTGRVKLGDGATAWNALPYSDWFTPDVLVEGTHVGISFAYDAATRRLNATVTGGSGGGTSVVASEAMTAGTLVNVWNDGGAPKARKADATAEGKEASGFVLADVAAGANAIVSNKGTVSGLTSMTPGARQYLAKLPGLRTETAPSAVGNVVQFVGIAMSESELAFELNEAIIRT